ncbi:MAG: hypothetical protein IKF38_01615 [Clostridia bacterium]|nr:hypothetical protein [Clostridia bacterium]
MKILKTEEKNNEKKQISREIDKKISNKIFINLLIAVAIMIYFCGLSVVYKNIQLDSIVGVVKIATLVFLAITLILIEIAYKKESKRVFIHSMETLALASHSLTTMHVIKIYDFDFNNYILISSYIFSVYYVLKSLIINTKARSDYLKGLSDISEIVQKDEPRKKEASKKEKNNITEIEKEEQEDKKTENSKKEEKKDNEKQEVKSLDEEIANSKNKIASIRERLERMQAKDKKDGNEVKEKEDYEDKKENKKEIIDKQGKQNQEENKEQALEENKIEENPKTKRKRGRPKKR